MRRSSRSYRRRPDTNTENVVSQSSTHYRGPALNFQERDSSLGGARTARSPQPPFGRRSGGGAPSPTFRLNGQYPRHTASPIAGRPPHASRHPTAGPRHRIDHAVHARRQIRARPAPPACPSEKRAPGSGEPRRARRGHVPRGALYRGPRSPRVPTDSGRSPVHAWAALGWLWKARRNEGAKARLWLARLGFDGDWAKTAGRRRVMARVIGREGLGEGSRR